MKNSLYKLILKYPASWYGNLWRESLPCGNGRIGASVYGGVHKETILLNHEELWYGGKRDTLPDISSTLAQARKLMQEGQYKEADTLSSKALVEQGYGTQVASFLPFGDLKVSMPCGKGFRHYRRILDMGTGEVTVRWEDNGIEYERSLFVSRTDDMVVYEIRSSGAPLDAEFSLSLHDPADSRYEFKDEGVIQSAETRAEGEYLYYGVKNDDGCDFGAVLRVIPTGGTIRAEGSTLKVGNARSILILAKLFVKGSRQQDWKMLQEALQAETRDYRSLLEAHAEVHGRLFHSASISLTEADSGLSNEELLLEAYEGDAPNSLMEKMWAYGRYLMISATRPDGLPCALYGLWCGDYHPIWCQHVANENVEMIYWHLAAGGLSELLLPLFRYYDSLKEDSRENAQKLFGCRGINIHGYTSPGIGLASIPVPVIMNWTGAAGWLASYYYDYYLHTEDMEFLKGCALPFMREAALFYEDFLVLGEDGYYTSIPSISPENTPGRFAHRNDFVMGHAMPTTINATMDFGIIRHLFGNLIQAALITGSYAEEIPNWKALLEGIPPYQINDDGAVKEWMHPDLDDNYNHRHLSHLYPVFPGREVYRERDPQLFQAFEKAVEKRLVVGLSDQSGWSLSHMANIYARMEEGDAALECLNLLSRSCLMNNFLTLHNDWRKMGIALEYDPAPYQIDANMGWTSAMQEMLLYASQEIIKLLPALPSRWKKGSFRDLCFYTGKVSAAWDMDAGKFTAELRADRDTHVLLKLPGQFTGYVFQCEGSVLTPSPLAVNCWELEIGAGQLLRITHEG